MSALPTGTKVARDRIRTCEGAEPPDFPKIMDISVPSPDGTFMRRKLAQRFLESGPFDRFGTRALWIFHYNFYPEKIIKQRKHIFNFGKECQKEARFLKD